MPSAGLPQEVIVGPHVPSSSQIQSACYKKWYGKPRLECVNGLIHLRKLLWVYYPGHSGVKGNDRTDRLAGKATLISGLLLGRSEVLRSLRDYLWAQSQEHHTVDRLEEIGVERGNASHLLYMDERGPSSVRRTLEHFQRQS